jgi:hypothetical protein
VPIAQSELTGQALPIIAASTSVTTPSNSNQPLPAAALGSRELRAQAAGFAAATALLAAAASWPRISAAY